MRTMTVHTSLAAVLAVWMAGCSAAGAPRVAMPDATLLDDDGSPGFLDRIASAGTVSENDAMRGLLMLMDGQDTCKTFKQRVDNLAARRIVGQTWRFDAAHPLTKGKLAYMIYQACNVPGGLILTLTGPSQRYCLRELQYRGMMSEGFGTTDVSGMEFVAVMTRADSYRRTRAVPDVISGRRRE